MNVPQGTTKSRLRSVERVERALRLTNMTIDQIAVAIFAQRDTVRYALDELLRAQKVKRIFADKPKTGRTAYLYSLVESSSDAGAT